MKSISFCIALLIALAAWLQHSRSNSRAPATTTTTTTATPLPMFQHFLEEEPDAPVSAADIAAEERVYKKSIKAYNHYAAHSLAAVAKKRKDFGAVRLALRRLVPVSVSALSGETDSDTNVFEARLAAVETRIRANAAFLREMVVAIGGDPNALGDAAAAAKRVAGRLHPHPESVVGDSDMDKVRSTLRQFVRDWSREGAKERWDTYEPIMEALERIFAHVPLEERGAISILVPGAGLGRLAFDIVRKGFTTQGNEFSFYMLIASNFVLNSMKVPNQHTIYPWVHSFSNMQNAEHQLRPVTIPDTAPGGIPETADFSMVAGDFLEVYGGAKERGAWDVLVSCYFIDTAKNIFEYLSVIWNTLKPGGTWINHGPLLYHFEGMKSEMSVELNLEELKAVAKAMGFVFEEERMMPSTYTSNENSMLKYVYNCAFWVARKPLESS